MSKVKFLLREPAAYVPKEKALVISDLHLGIELELKRRGVRIPPLREKLESRVKELARRASAKRLIILGDLKHEIGSSKLVEREIVSFVENVSELVDVTLVQGNHDGKIKEILTGTGIRIFGSGGFKKREFGFFHGHAWPSPELLSCDWLLMGHVHPTIEIVDEFGMRFKEQVWVKSRLIKGKLVKKYSLEEDRKLGRLNLIILPSFNTLLGGANVLKREELLSFGPLFKNGVVDLEKMEIYGLDGVPIFFEK